MKSIFKNIALSLGLAVLPFAAAIAGPGTGAGTTNMVQNTRVAFGTTVSVYGETFYIGPGDNIIEGTLEIFSNKIWIAPNANITGPGLIILRDPADNPFWEDMPAAPTRIDHNNGAPIEVNIRLMNPNNILLADIADPGFSSTNPPAPLAAALHLGNDLDLAVNNGDVILNGNDLILTSVATISNYGQQRMVVTGNSIAGHIVREAAAGTFTYPVGIAEGDYTPATITPVTAQQLHVAVTNYNATTATILAPQEGMYRAWHVFAGNSVAANVTLQHNVITNGSAYTDNLAFITQYQGAAVWSSQPVTGYNSAGVHTLNAVPLATGTAQNSTWLTKTSDAITPLPVKLLSFDGMAKGCKTWLTWQSAEEKNFSRYEVERSSNGAIFARIGMVQATGSNSTYTYTDLNPSKGNNIYRLKMIDTDETSVYSQYVTIQPTCADRDITLYPNPSDGIVNIKGLDGSESLQLLDATGRLLQIHKATANIMQLNLAPYAGGMYQLRIISNDKVINTFKIAKAK